MYFHFPLAVTEWLTFHADFKVKKPVFFSEGNYLTMTSNELATTGHADQLSFSASGFRVSMPQTALWIALPTVGQDSLAQLLSFVSFVLEHDETGSAPCVALM